MRVERVQDISEEDCKKEGVELLDSIWTSTGQLEKYKDYSGKIRNTKTLSDLCEVILTERKSFKTLWNSIYEKRGDGWTANPFCWVLEFKEIKREV